LATEPRCDFARTVLRPASAMTREELGDIGAELRRQAEAYFAQSGIAANALSHGLHIDLRYVGQEHTVTVAVPNPDTATVASVLDGSQPAHDLAYPFSLTDPPVEFVTFRLSAPATVPRPKLMPLDAAGRSPEAARRPSRMVDFGEDGRHEAAVYRRELLPP